MFGDKRFSLKDLPTDKHVIAGGPCGISEFSTSPVPTIRPTAPIAGACPR